MKDIYIIIGTMFLDKKKKEITIIIEYVFLEY